MTHVPFICQQGQPGPWLDADTVNVAEIQAHATIEAARLQADAVRLQAELARLQAESVKAAASSQFYGLVFGMLFLAIGFLILAIGFVIGMVILAKQVDPTLKLISELQDGIFSRLDSTGLAAKASGGALFGGSIVGFLAHSFRWGFGTGAFLFTTIALGLHHHRKRSKPADTMEPTVSDKLADASKPSR